MYEKQEWSNVYGETPFNAERIKHIEDGIYNNSVNLIDELYYKDGDTFTDIGYIACIGHLTSSQKSIYFTLPVEKRLDNIATITINSISANIRHADGGYVAQGDLTTLGTVSVSKSTNTLLRVRFDLTVATTFVNNAPLAVDITDIKVTFNK